MKKLIISNKEVDGVMKIIKFLEESGLFIKGVRETMKQKMKQNYKKVNYSICYYVN